MAWQLHYTSAEAGPAGRAGFQFVAESPGLPHGVTGKVARHLAYKPPPTAPLAPAPEQIARMPVALSYAPLGELSVVTRCVYLGRDYSGRYGNFLGHAVVATAEELTGLRPVELWRSPLWQDVPASSGTPLPELADLPPGEAVDPDTLGAWLASGGDAAYVRLGGLLENVRRALAGGQGRIVLVCADVEEIVRWIAVVSCSLPWPVAARLSFVTYSADPAGAPHIIVGTTPDVWMPTDVEAAVVRLDAPADAGARAPAGATVPADPRAPADANARTGSTVSADATVKPGRFARTVTDCWRRMDLDGIDAIGELGAPPGSDTFDAAAVGGDAAAGWGAFDPDTSAALLAFCRGDTSVTDAEQSAIARALSKDLPDWLWDDLARAAGRMGFELASAVRAHAPEETAELCALRCAVLALTDPALPAPSPASRPETRGALAAETARALAAARDLEELGHAARTAYAVGAPIDAAGLERTAAALARDGRGDLARLLERLPAGLRDTVLSGAVAGLEHSSAGVRDQMLVDAVCERLWRHDLTHAPRTGTAVILSLVRRERLTRVQATEELLRLAPYATASVPDPTGTEISDISGTQVGPEEPEDIPAKDTTGGCDERTTDLAGPASWDHPAPATRGHAAPGTVATTDPRTGGTAPGSWDGPDPGRAVTSISVPAGTAPGAWSAPDAGTPDTSAPGPDADPGNRGITGQTTTAGTSGSAPANSGPREAGASGSGAGNSGPREAGASGSASGNSGPREAGTSGSASGDSGSGEAGASGSVAGHSVSWVTGEVGSQRAVEWDAGLVELWEQAPGPGECAVLVERLGAALSDSSALSDLPARAFLAAGLDDPEVVRLAGQVRHAVPGYPAKDAEVVLLAAGAGEAARPADAAAVLQRLEELAREAHEDLPAAARAVVAHALAERDARFRAEVLTLLPGAPRGALARAWLAARGSRDEEFALLEVAVRLHMADAPVPELDSWARARLGGWSISGSAEARFKRDPELVAGLKDLKDATKGRRGRPWKREDR
ncbi:hypothetical protein [Sphaerisporangium album]|uniref:GAP1-N2 domain-containing protein n=1 Tax=Sphaerisporangium album TaxID=509200 RepID=UPI0015F0A6C1|nr:hypothetical protein [Sphaerisporangium album]